MLPVTHGDEYTRLNILLYTILLVLITIIPYLTGMSGLIYLTIALVLDAMFLRYAIQMRRNPENLELPMRSFKFSINYLGILFADRGARTRERGSPRSRGYRTRRGRHPGCSPR